MDTSARTLTCTLGNLEPLCSSLIGLTLSHLLTKKSKHVHLTDKIYQSNSKSTGLSLRGHLSCAASTQGETWTSISRLSFVALLFRCGDALHRNKHLITFEQRAYQKELERNYTKLTEQLEPLLKNKFGSLRGSTRQKCGIVFCQWYIIVLLGIKVWTF